MAEAVKKGLTGKQLEAFCAEKFFEHQKKELKQVRDS
jgi:hypothetical protein